jgi:hypothetical protein
LVFVAYDAVIEKRQRKVMQSATRSSAIVSSLFPLKVRTRLYEESAPALSEKEQSPQNRLKNFLVKAHTSSIDPINTEPIADLFESTTVLFADIKGFTKWYVLFGKKEKLSSCSKSWGYVTGVRPENRQRFSSCWRHCMVPTTNLPKRGECTR